MGNIENIKSGERLSFYKLFKEKEYKIIIPIIQRDYAQGRQREKEVRDTFLDSLYNYLDDNKPNRDLDFIYGTLTKDKDIINFIPLDGQQRLTTLFLLHWYLYQISDDKEKKEEFIKYLVKDGKSMFAYETRISSTDFCNSLITANIDIDNLLKPDENKNNSLSKTIKNLPWYYLTWEYDPTIQAMLTMLDAIHKKFQNKKEFFPRLLDTDNPIITFLFLNLEEYKLTDDLYIKMNSRGKPLTPFENFKAKFEQYLEKIDTKKNYKLTFNDNGNQLEETVSLKEYFSNNIDKKWADLFWQYRNLQNRSRSKVDNNFDDELMNFIRVIFTNQYTLTLNLSSKEKDDTLEYLLGTQVAKKRTNYSDVISFNKYQELGVLAPNQCLGKNEEECKSFIKQSKNIIEFLIVILDEFSNANNKIKTYISNNFKSYYDENKSFENALKHEFDSYHERLMFFAYISFLLKNTDNRNGINQWMRVIHNITHPDNTIIDSATDFSRAIKSIENILAYSDNVLNFLKGNPTIDFFSSWQVSEEKIKAHLITKNNDWKDQIQKAEKHDYFNGQIGFILEFAGIVDYYKEHEDCEWSEKDNNSFYKKFSEYAKKSSVVFAKSYENRINDKDFIFERAVLTKGDYLTSASQNRFNLLSTSQVENNIKRDHSWKRLLRISGDENWKEKREFAKQVFDDNRFDVKNIIESLKSISKVSTNDWRDYFIKCPSLIAYCKQGFIRFENEHNILLYSQSQSNHYHAEMYTYYLWKKIIEPEKETYKTFKNIYYVEVKSIDDNACIVFSEFLHNRINYEINIFYDDNDDLSNPYEIKFLKSKGDNFPEKYGDSVKEVLENCDYEWNDYYKGYFFTCKESNELIVNLKKITEKLRNI